MANGPRTGGPLSLAKAGGHELVPPCRRPRRAFQSRNSQTRKFALCANSTSSLRELGRSVCFKKIQAVSTNYKRFQQTPSKNMRFQQTPRTPQGISQRRFSQAVMSLSCISTKYMLYLSCKNFFSENSSFHVTFYPSRRL